MKCHFWCECDGFFHADHLHLVGRRVSELVVEGGREGRRKRGREEGREGGGGREREGVWGRERDRKTHFFKHSGQVSSDSSHEPLLPCSSLLSTLGLQGLGGSESQGVAGVNDMRRHLTNHLL